MLKQITSLADLEGKTIEATESNIYGLAIKFTDSSYAIFEMTIQEQIVLSTDRLSTPEDFKILEDAE